MWPMTEILGKLTKRSKVNRVTSALQTRGYLKEMY